MSTGRHRSVKRCMGFTILVVDNGILSNLRFILAAREPPLRSAHAALQTGSRQGSRSAKFNLWIGSTPPNPIAISSDSEIQVELNV